jgi:hypothetical protein
MVIITSEEVKAHLIPNLQNFKIEKISFTNSKILKAGDFVDCVEINLISTQRVLDEIIKYLEDSYLGKFDISYYYQEANYY